MEFEQSYIPKDLRPIIVPRTITDEPPRIAVVSTATATPLETSSGNPQIFHNLDASPSIPLFYPATASDSAFVYANPPPMAWAPRIPPPMAAVTGFGYSPNLGTRVVSNAVDNSGSLSAIPHSAVVNRIGTTELTATPVNYSPNSEEGNDDSASGKKVKFLCSFGGKILPRPSDGVLRYVGGQTRIISVKRDVSFNELMQKMADTCGQPVVTKYQLPDEDLDALVSVSCPDDLDNMMDEYEKLVERSSDSSAKLRVFLFSSSDFDSPRSGDLIDNGLRYVDAVNGIMEGFSNRIARRGSAASATSTQNSDYSANEDVNGAQTKSSPQTPQMGISVVKSGLSSPHTLSSPQSEIEFERAAPVTLAQQQLGFDYQLGINTPHSSQMQAYLDPNRTDYRHHHGQMRLANPQFGVSPHHYVSQVHMTMAHTSHVSVRPTVQPLVQPQQPTRIEHFSDENTYGKRFVQVPMDPSYNAYQPQYPPSYTRQPVLQKVAFSEKFQRLEDCLMCQKALPHAHSDPLVQHQKESGLYATPDTHSIHQSLLNRGTVAGAMEDAPLEQIVGGARSNAYSPIDHQVGLQQPESLMFFQNPMLQDNVRTNNCVPVTPQSRLEDSQYLMPSQYQNKRISPHYAPGVIQASELPVHQSPVEFYGMLPGVVSKGHAVESSCISSGQMSPIGGMMESLWTNSDQNKSLAVKTREEISHLDVTYNKQPVVIDSTHVNKQTEVMPASLEASFAYNSQQMGSYPQSQIAVHLVDKDNTSFGKTAFSGNETAYVVDRTSPVQWANCGIQLQPIVGSADTQTASDSKSSFEDVQASSNSLLSNQDPWNLRPDSHVPPKPNKILTRREDIDAKDPFSGNNSSISGESVKDGISMDVINQPLNDSKDIDSEQGQSSQGSAEERIKQELQAVADIVAASDFSVTSPSSDSTVHEQNELTHGDSQDKGISSKNTEIQQKAKFEDVVSKVPEKLNFGFPVSGGLGRLQIIKNSDLEELQELGSGTFGTVYHGKWRGTDVAIKRINERCFVGKTSEQERMIEDFWNEAIKLAELHHPNVVAFYGMVLDGPGNSVATVTEFMVNGSLRNALQKNERSLDKRKRLLVAMDVAFGMEYLHGKNIVHFDLKSDNLLVNLRDPHRPICKVGDLGLSKVKCHTLISGGVRGTLPWMAPELLNGSSSLVSEKVDVFSFSIVLWELLTGEEPYADLHYGAIIGGIVSNTLRPPVPETCDPEWKTLMERCWSSEPSERPNFTIIANELRAMATKTSPKGQNSAQPQQFKC